MKMEYTEGQVEMDAGAGVFGNDGDCDIKPGHLGDGHGGLNGTDRVYRAGSSNEAQAAGTGLLGLGRTGMKPKTHCLPTSWGWVGRGGQR